MDNPAPTLRAAYADEVAALARVEEPAIRNAYAAVPRERFLGPGPWLIPELPNGYQQTPDADLAHIYRNIVVALDPAKGLNNGQPTFWAFLFDRLRPRAGERAIHVGAGTGYYSAILAELVGPAGQVTAIEFEPGLAAKAAANLADRANVEVLQGDALQLAVRPADVVVASCGFDAVPVDLVRLLTDGGRLLIPLTAAWRGLTGIGGGAMLLVTRRRQAIAARFVGGVGIYHSMSGRTETATARLAEALGAQAMDYLQRPPPDIASLRLSGEPDASCWLAGDGWWLSREAAA